MDAADYDTSALPRSVLTYDRSMDPSIRGAVLCVAVTLLASEAPLKPVRVCEVLADLSARDGKVVAVLGRFSFRENGRFIGEDACDPTPAAGDPARPSVLRVVFDPKSAPPLAARLELDAADVYPPLKLIRQRTALGKFRFGSVEYDRWAVVFGRIEAGSAIKTASKPPAPAQIVCRGESAVLVISDPDR